MRLIACDVVQKRLDNIRPRLARAGVEADLRLIGQNGGGVEEFNGAADLVFVDAPCGGSGTWRRRPEDAWRLKPDEVERLHALQLRILSQAAQLVKPGGRLAYVTCSMLSRENEASADAFEAAHPEFQPVPVAAALASRDLTDGARDRLADLAAGHRLRLSPASTHTDGFFLALYERRA
jgi:16S rRNA (cytosine967-C5)-methyltransferase